MAEVTSEREAGLPSVSVVIPTRDRRELLQLALDRVLAQEYAGDIECLVVYDQSQPQLDDAEVRPGRRIRVLVNDRTPGTAGARNCALLAASGQLFALCDDDDAWRADKLRLEVAALREAPDAVAVGSGYVGHTDGQRTDRIPPATLLTHADFLRSRVADLHPSTLVFRRDRLVSEVGLVDEQLPGSYGEDYDWLLRASAVGPIVAVREPLVEVLWHRGSYFDEHWDVMIQAIRYLIEKHRDLEENPRGLARLYGRIAFASAVLGQRRDARAWGLRAARLNPAERRAWLALAVSAHLLPAALVNRLAAAAGRRV